MTRRTRSELLRLFEPALGREAATALVEEIEVVDPDRLATKADLSATRQDLHADIATTREELRREIADARVDVHHRIGLLEERMDGRFGRVDERFSAVDQRFEAVHAAIGLAKNEVLAAYRGEIAAAVSGQTRAIIFAMAGTVASLGGLAIALTQFA